MAVKPSNLAGPDAMEDEVPVQTKAHGDSGVLENAQSLLQELLDQAQDRFQLAVLEARRAGESLVDMVAAGVIVGILLAGAWLGSEAAAVLWLIEHGIAASGALLLATSFNMLLALILCGVIRRKSHYLQFPATLRSLQPMSKKQKDAVQP